MISEDPKCYLGAVDFVSDGKGSGDSEINDGILTGVDDFGWGADLNNEEGLSWAGIVSCSICCGLGDSSSCIDSTWVGEGDARARVDCGNCWPVNNSEKNRSISSWVNDSQWGTDCNINKSVCWAGISGGIGGCIPESLLESL